MIARKLFFILLMGWMLVAPAATPTPNLPNMGGVILREAERSTGKHEMAPAPLVPAEQPPAEAPLPQQAGQTVFVTSFRIKATRFSEEELLKVLKDYVGRALTMAELQEAARKLGDYYHQHDFLAHAFLPPQTVRKGVVEITVVEGRLGEVQVDPSSTTRLDHKFAASLVQSRAGINQGNQSLHPSALDEAVMILNEVPGVHATSTLAPGANESESIAVLKIEDGPMLGGSLTLDRAGSHSTGADRALTSVSLSDPLGHGEQFSAVNLLTSGSTYARLGAVVPVGISGLTLGVNGSALGYTVGGTLTPLDLNGFAWTLGLTAGYPIVRTSNFSLTGSATFDYKRMVDWGNHAMLDEKRIQVGTFGLSAMVKDDWMGGGTNRLGATLSLGHLDLSNQPTSLAADQAAGRTNGTYGKLVFTAAREQPLIDKLTLSTNFQAQISHPNLDSSEQFSLGGQEGIRAYPPSEAGGDGGWMTNLELQWQATETAKLFTFYDIGGIQQHNQPWTNWQTVPNQPNSYTLQGAGIGATWTLSPSLQVKAMLAHTIGNNPGQNREGNDSDGNHHQIRGWAQAVFSF